MSFRVAIIVSDFNAHVTSRLLEGAQGYLARNGVSPENQATFHVAGAFEIPLMAQKLAETNKYDLLVSLGAVIRGETSHYDFVCRAVTDGISRVSLDFGIPIGFGILTTENADQALDRAGGSHGNKGEEAARAALDLLTTLQAV